MRLRIASISFLLGAVNAGLVWLSVQPAMLRLLEAVQRLAPAGSPDALLVARVRGMLPLWLGLALGGSLLLTYGLLHLMVERPLRETEALVERVGQQEGELAASTGGGPLLRRLHLALARTSRALAEARERTARQLQDLQRANAQLARTQTELVAAERLATVGRLAAGVAHEVGNPLGGILGYLSLMRMRHGTDPVLVDSLERIEAEVHRIDGIVRGLLDLGRARAAQPQPVELRRHVEGMLRLVSAGADLARVVVEQDVPAELVARCEPGALSQILLNLLLNAAQAMGGEGRVRVVARREGTQLVLAVEDEGPGIPPEVLPHLFEPFFTTKPPGQGTGLGLAIAQHLATQQGGELSAANRPEGGACFRLALPAV